MKTMHFSDYYFQPYTSVAKFWLNRYVHQIITVCNLLVVFRKKNVKLVRIQLLGVIFGRLRRQIQIVSAVANVTLHKDVIKRLLSEGLII